MPLYDYECQRCWKVQEKQHPFNEENKERCEACHAEPEFLKKQLSPIQPHVSWSKWRI